jgi:hypothetical protein
MIGTVVSPPEVMRVRNGEAFALHIQVQFADGLDVQTVQYMPLPGEDSVPVQGCKVAVIDIGGVQVAVAGYDKIRPCRGQGEKEFYSSDGLVKLARLVLKASGHLYIGSVKNSRNLYDVIKALADALKTLAAGICANGSTLSNSATVISSVNTMIADLQKVLTNDPGDITYD